MQVSVLDAGSGFHFEPGDSAVRGRQDKINLVPVLRPEVGGRDRLFGPAHLLEDLPGGERLDEMPELGQHGGVAAADLRGAEPEQPGGPAPSQRPAVLLADLSFS